MAGNQLLLVVDGGLDQDGVSDRARAVLSHWRGQDRPDLIVSSLDDLLAEPSTLGGAQVAWLVLKDDNSAQAFELIGLVQDQRLPAVISLSQSEPGPTAYDDGIVACPLDATPDLTCSVIRSLWSQAPVLAEMHREIKLLRVQEGGLCGQISQLDEELRMAAQLQKEFMPTEMPRVDGAGFDVLWRPAGYVSGDIYDVVQLDDTHVGLFIADAVGHGVPAALMTVHIQRSMPTKVPDPSSEDGYRICSPGEALGILNQEMLKHQTGKVRFATACYAVINTKTHELTLARAGHPYPLILHADGRTETIEPEGGLLGVFPNEQFEEITVQLVPGDRVLLYSDGFEVAFPTHHPTDDADQPGKQKIANDQYAQEFEDLRHGNAQAALDRLAQRLNMQSGSLNQRDDLTIVCLTITEPAHKLAEQRPEPPTESASAA